MLSVTLNAQFKSVTPRTVPTLNHFGDVPHFLSPQLQQMLQFIPCAELLFE